MGIKDRKSIHCESTSLTPFCNPPKEVFLVFATGEYPCSCDTSPYEVMNGPGGVKACMARHDESYRERDGVSTISSL